MEQLALRALRAGGTLFPLVPLRTGRPLRAGLSLDTLCALYALGTLRSDRPGRSLAPDSGE